MSIKCRLIKNKIEDVRYTMKGFRFIFNIGVYQTHITCNNLKGIRHYLSLSTATSQISYETPNKLKHVDFSQKSCNTTYLQNVEKLCQEYN